MPVSAATAPDCRPPSTSSGRRETARWRRWHERLSQQRSPGRIAAGVTGAPTIPVPTSGGTGILSSISTTRVAPLYVSFSARPQPELRSFSTRRLPQRTTSPRGRPHGRRYPEARPELRSRIGLISRGDAYDDSTQLHQLAYFVTVAETRHFTHAAERLRVAQPSVSQ